MSMLTAIQHASIASKVATFGSPAASSEDRFVGKPLPLATLVYLATLGGAKVCNLDSKIGSLDPGKDFDALLINANPSRGNPGLLTCDDTGAEDVESGWTLLEKFLFSGDDRNISKVWVKGRLVASS